MTHEEIELRKAEIRAQLEGDTEGLDIQALTEEVGKLNAEETELRKKAEEEAELRKLVAEGKEGSPVPTIIEKKEERKIMFERDSKEYRNAWLKKLSGKAVTEDEQHALTELRSGESLTGDTSTAGYAIPTITANKIIENLVQLYPLIGEIDLMQIPGNVRIAVENTVNAAAIHTENAAITAADDTLTKIDLGGYEIVKLLTVSAKLNAMEIDAFEAWIVSNLTRKLGELIENYIVNGTGSSQPKGIDYAATWADGTNAVDWASTAPTIAELIKQVSLLNAAYAGGAKWLMNHKTFWQRIVALRDDNNPTLVNIENMHILGFPVLISSKVNDDDIFFGNFREGMVANMAAPIAVESDMHSGFRSNSIDYRGACLFDCQPVGSGRIVKSAATL